VILAFPATQQDDIGAQDRDQRRTKKTEKQETKARLVCRKSKSAVVKWKMKPRGTGPDLVGHEKIKTQNKMILDLEKTNQTMGK
jgi:hypothetical protein